MFQFLLILLSFIDLHQILHQISYCHKLLHPMICTWRVIVRVVATHFQSVQVESRFGAANQRYKEDDGKN